MNSNCKMFDERMEKTLGLRWDEEYCVVERKTVYQPTLPYLSIHSYKSTSATNLHISCKSIISYTYCSISMMP